MDDKSGSGFHSQTPLIIYSSFDPILLSKHDALDLI